MFNLLRQKSKKPVSSDMHQAIVLPLHINNRSVEFLSELVNKVRPDHTKDFEQATIRFQAFLHRLSTDKSLLYSLRKALLREFTQKNIVTALTENGIISERGFVQELMGKIKHKLLPELQRPDDFLLVINKVFYKKYDYLWVEAIDNDLWGQLFKILGIEVNLTDPHLMDELCQALQMLSHRIAAQGLEKEIVQGYDKYKDAVFPFIEQNRLINLLIYSLQFERDNSKKNLLIANIYEMLHNCNQSIQWIKDQRPNHGISLAQTFVLTRLQQHISRVLIILDALDTDHNFDTDRFVGYFKTVVRNTNTKNSIRAFISENTGLLAYQIAEHGGTTGEKFITTTRREYRKMFRSAMGGGVIISFIGIIKSLLGKLPFAPFWQGFFYSVNYSIGFILIQDTGSTLATKQPAYTANHVASSFDSKKIGETHDVRNVVITLAKVCRTQFASFAGNLVIVFPLTYFLAASYFKITGVKIASGDQAHQMIASQQMFHSLALLYACFTGFFLFASGLVAGYVENYMVNGKIGSRLRSLSFFNKRLSEQRRFKIIHYIEQNLGALIGNIALGFFLGMAAFLGQTFGLPFDIRHITISAANTAIGFLGIDHVLSYREIIYTVLSVLTIGFLNFAISFGLSFYVAIKSRGIQLNESSGFGKMLWRYFKKYPLDFVRAPSKRNRDDFY